MESHPMSEEISWSRHAAEHVALLQQSTVPTRPIGNSAGLTTFLALAYAVPLQRISGDVGSTERYQIEAKAEEPFSATTEQLRQMLHTLISDKFKLKVHRETKETDG